MKDKLTLAVKGMSCQHCVRNVQNVLQTLSGVKEAKVNLDKEKVDVSYVPGSVSVDGMIKAVKEAGYEASLL